jgi:hypothetical protein
MQSLHGLRLLAIAVMRNGLSSRVGNVGHAIDKVIQLTIANSMTNPADY